ncbi:putative protein YaaN [Clostridiaceae bacterium JG1575]|nr:putative protein YaaN [Clostridiaceae bacterium JG1575]
MPEEITLKNLARTSQLAQTAQEEKEQEIAKITRQVETISPAERQRIDEIKETIDLMDSQMTEQFGVGAQKNIAAFSETILSQIKSKDAGYVGEIMTDLMTKVKDSGMDSQEDEGFLRKIPFFGKFAQSSEKYMARFQNLETQIDKIESELDKARMGLLKDIGVLDNLYQKNVDYFNDLQLYILAGEEKIEELRKNTLPRLRQEALDSNDPMASQLVNDFENTVNRFEKKVHDLKLSKTLAIQTAPQIKLIQNNDKSLVDKIQTAVLNTIPLWKSQVVIALSLSKQKAGLEMQRSVSDTTNDLLRRNSELLKSNTLEVAKESERGIVELDTLKKVNDDLISTIEETIKIQREGQTKRLAAEQELLKIEDTLKQSLLKSVGAGPVPSEGSAQGTAQNTKQGNYAAPPEEDPRAQNIESLLHKKVVDATINE